MLRAMLGLLLVLVLLHGDNVQQILSHILQVLET